MPGAAKACCIAVLRDGVKDHAKGLVFGEFEDLGQMPGDRLSLAVQVCRQVERVGGLGGGLERCDHFFSSGHHLVGRLEIVFDIDIDAFAGQVADVPHRGLDLKAGAKVLIDRLGLGRRFDNYQ